MINSPVLLITFNRPVHTKRTIDALRTQAPPTMYVFQDGPRDSHPNDFVLCDEVRKVVYDLIDWECDLHVYSSEINRGCRDAVIFAITEVLKNNDTVIVVEDDIITSPAFYEYMCKALDYYKKFPSVFSISGYSCSPSKFKVPDNYDYDVYASPRLFNWGWATWRDKWDKADWTMSYYNHLLNHEEEIVAFNRGGNDMFLMLKDEFEGRSSAWDIQFAFTHFSNHAVSIVPCISYTYNIGLDGSGTHCFSSSNNNQTIDYVLNQNKSPIFLDILYFDRRILNSIHSIFTRSKRPFWKRCINKLFRMFGAHSPYTLKSKIYY